MEHLLLEYAKKKKYNETPVMPEDVYYDEQRGYWVKEGVQLISYESEFETLATKKHDIETGEDMKGE